MRFIHKSGFVTVVLILSMCSIDLAGFVRFVRRGGAPTAPAPTAPVVIPPSIAPDLTGTIWTGIGELTIDKVYFTNTKDEQKTAIVSPKINCRMEIWFPTATTFTVLVDTTYLAYDSKHRKYEPMLGNQLSLNFPGGPLYGYTSTGTLNLANRTFVGDHDAGPPPDDSNDIPECTTTVSGTYYFTGSGSSQLLIPSVIAVQVPFDTDRVVFDNATCTGTFSRDTSRTVSGELAKPYTFTNSP